AVARQAQKRQVTVEYEVAPDVNTIVSDQGKLRQIVYNFLAWGISRSNADQRVTISGEITDKSKLVLRIDDQGEPVTNASQVFEIEDSSGEANVNELGIMIAGQLIKLLKGTVALRQRDGGGLEVMIELPARPEHE